MQSRRGPEVTLPPSGAGGELPEPPIYTREGSGSAPGLPSSRLARPSCRGYTTCVMRRFLD